MTKNKDIKLTKAADGIWTLEPKSFAAKVWIRCQYGAKALFGVVGEEDLPKTIRAMHKANLAVDTE